MATAQDQVIPGEVKALNQAGHDGQKITVFLPCQGQGLEKGGVNIQSFDGGRDRTPDMEERVEIGFRKDLAKDLQASLPASHSGEPVMNQGDSGHILTVSK